MPEIRTLGGLEIRLGGRPINGILAPKSVALLCYLAVTTHGRACRPYTRAALAGLLWGEATEANARSYLRQALAQLRLRASPHLTITRSTVAFDAASPHWLDVAAFEHCIFPADPKAFTPPDLSALEEAVDLYHGDFMAGFYVRRAPAFEEWMLLERERLRLEALRALHALIRHFSARGQHARAVDYAASLLALEPADEGVQRQMMSLLAQSGRQAAALHQYEICRQVLDELIANPYPHPFPLTFSRHAPFLSLCII